MNKNMTAPKKTEELDKLLNSITSLTDLENYLSDNLIPEFDSISEYFTYILEQKQLSKSEVIRESGIQRTYGYQIFSGVKQKPGRDKIIAISIAMGLNLEETNRGLSIAEESKLYSKNQRDAVIIYSIQNKLDIFKTNNTLYEYGLDALTTV